MALALRSNAAPPLNYLFVRGCANQNQCYSQSDKILSSNARNVYSMSIAREDYLRVSQTIKLILDTPNVGIGGGGDYIDTKRIQLNEIVHKFQMRSQTILA